MGKRIELQAIARFVLGQSHVIVPNDLGADAVLCGKGFTLETEAWEVEGLGHLCSLRMRGPLGLLLMETLFVVPTQVDAPVANFDWMYALGTHIQLIELYDTQLQPWPRPNQDELDLIGRRDATLADVTSDESHWYDEILYPCRYAKKGTGKEAAERLELAAYDGLVAYLDQLTAAPACDEQEKRDKVRAFAERLSEEDGPSVSFIGGLFGDEVARRMVVRHIYGVREA